MSRQISSELKHYYHIEGLDDVRVIRDRQTSKALKLSQLSYAYSQFVLEQSRQFGFLRFSTLQEAEAFMDRNYPVLYLYGDSSKSNGDASKVRIAFGRERKEQSRNDDADWICSMVSLWFLFDQRRPN